MSENVFGIFISEVNLTSFGERVAGSLKPDGRIRTGAVVKKLKSSLRRLRERNELLTREFSGEKRPQEAAEWLLDNWYLAQREGITALRELSAEKRFRAKSRSAVILELADALLKSGHGRVTAVRMELFLTGFQRALVLSRRELSLIVPAIRAALVTRLSEAADRSMDTPEDGKLMGRLITSLRLLGALDLSDLLERIDLCEQALRLDPAGIYPLMDEKTRDSYRRRVAILAKKFGASEHRIAMRVLRMSESARGPERHVGHFLFVRPMGEKISEPKGGAYISANILLSLFFALLAGFLTDSAITGIFLLLPISELIKYIFDVLILKLTRPRHVPRLELAEGIPERGRTLCVISALLTGIDSGERLSKRLEEFRLSNRDAGANLLFGILADLPETKNPEDGADRWIESAAGCIEGLNSKYGGGFFLLCRDRIKREGDKSWRGHERKRGAIMSLAGLLCGEGGEPGGVYVAAGSALSLKGVKYILTLDTDTSLTPGSARELAGAMLHPLNAPVIDEKRRVVVSGHAVIHPRMAVELYSATQSGFSRIFAGQGGMDPYGGDAGEVYMDLFGRGGFSGKGIIDVSALLTCLTDRIPEETVLSHDALEGAYLRGGYMSDVELTDCFPSGVSAYYRRMHRWVRGDWQNMPWIFRRGRVFAEIDRWRLFDSLRRSLVAPFTFLSLLAGFFLPSMRLMGAAAALCLGTELLFAAADTLFRTDDGGKVRYHSVVIHGLSGAIMRTAARLLLLPYEAWICVWAAATSLWRMAVTRKNMLSWQTAAQTESATRGRLLATVSDMWLPVLTGILSILFAPTVLGRAIGVLWAGSVFFAVAMSRIREIKREPTEHERSFLRQCAEEIWGFFERYCTHKDHYLPPDNVQEQPPLGVAHRTSPTNIGLCLISALAAMDMGLTSREKALQLIDRVLGTMERMPKWNGHFYNWYDTRTLKSLRPDYISTVDSGNLASCLTALREGLYGENEPALAMRADKLLSPMDFSPLYDKSRRLFYIGIDTEKNAPSEGWYDLLASEARLSGYFAIARGDVERRHWRRLGRSLVRKDGYQGMASWTGTMFEYLMPELLMPCYKHSLLYESAKFCLYVQKRRVAEKRIPWGISESAFMSLDGSLAYRYKAHGCGALALKRGMDEETVISPYSSFLALSVDPSGVIRNLKKLDGLGARGGLGFFEAVDFTASRLIDGKPRVVRCVMAHHLGMSLVSIDNVLCDGAMQKRFMSDPAMRAHAGLLQEKVPIGGVLLHRRAQEPPQKPVRAVAESWHISGAGFSAKNPARGLLSNGVYRIMATSNGETAAFSSRISIYRSKPYDGGADGPYDANPSGVTLSLRLYDELIPLLPVCAGGDAEYSWNISAGECQNTREGGGIKAVASVSVPASENGELRRVSVVSAEDRGEARLLLSFEPILCRENDYNGHPAFFRLGMESFWYKGTLMLRRLERGELGEMFLCAACDRELDADCSGAIFNRRGGLRDNALGWQRAPIVTISAGLSLEAGKTRDTRFALALGATAHDAYVSAQKILASTAADIAALASIAAAPLSLSAFEIGESMSLMGAIINPPGNLRSGKRAGEGREGLWRFGISGDIPIVSARLGGEDFSEFAKKLIRRHALLSDCGYSFDLAFITDEGGDYLRRRTGSIWEILRKMGRESEISSPGGVFCADASMDTLCLEQCSALMLTPEAKFPEYRADDKIMLTEHVKIVQKYPKYSWNDDGGFEFYVNHSLPPRAWGNMLTNGKLGYFATDCGTGHMWYNNARECRVTRWSCDPFAVKGSEDIEICFGGESCSVFARPGDKDCKITYNAGSAVWEKNIGGIYVKATAFVPADLPCRVIIIECENTDAAVSSDAKTDLLSNAEIIWSLDLVLSGDDKDAVQVFSSYEDGVLCAENPRSPYADTLFCAMSENPPEGYTFDGNSSELNSAVGSFINPRLTAKWSLRDSLAIVCGFADKKNGPADREKLMALTDIRAAKASLALTRDGWDSFCGKIKINTPDEKLNRYYNGWCVYQTIACRMLGRSSIYQSGGAFGFRDQLQDAVNMIVPAESMAREQILFCAAHQYKEGDVLHWWHPHDKGCKGVRTRCSDDLLWLPWAVAEYAEKTGDYSILDESAPYLVSPVLEEGERERYEIPKISDERGSLTEHMKRAIELVYERGFGEHSLLLIGTGDWNDGFDRVGALGRGESVWLTWFFSHTARRISSLLKKLGDEDYLRYEGLAKITGEAADAAWDGDWYLRGYFDDGAPLGTESGACCKIDSISQSFSVLCGFSDPEKRKSALKSALNRLFDREKNIVRLFAPPFLDSGQRPGYIESYGPGFRENGGQYTHAAIWLAMALLKEGMTEDGLDVLLALLPENHPPERYAAEPYVIAADVYSAPGSEGVAGWSWYTGSSGWYFRVVTEELLGLRVRNGLLYIEPRLPREWASYSALWRREDGESINIEVTGGDVRVNGCAYDGAGLAL